MQLPDPAQLPDGKEERELGGSELLNPPRASNSPAETVKIPIPQGSPEKTCFSWSERVRGLVSFRKLTRGF